MRAIQPLHATLQPRAKVTLQSPIGVFDSGIGGLSVALHVLQYLPNERILYFADTANVPYGAREDEEIRQLTAQAIEWLYQQGCKLVIVACNTASAFSLDYLRAHYGDALPIVGLVPAVKPAVLQTQSKVVAVLATEATFRGKLINDVLDNFAKPLSVTVLPIISHQLVPMIEAGQSQTRAMQQLLWQKLQPALAQNADFLVLGCTHYPFLTEILGQLYPQLKLVDSGQAVARQCGRILAKFGLNQNAPYQSTVQLDLVFSGNNKKVMREIITRLLGQQVGWRFWNLNEYG